MSGWLSGQLRKSAFWALLGDTAPMFAAMVAAPYLLDRLGLDRLGLLSLIWVVVGYFSFLDLGMGRAVTVAIAALQHRETPVVEDEIRITGTAVVALVFLGMVGAALLGIGLWIAHTLGKVGPSELDRETTAAIFWMMPSLPLLLLASGLRGHLEGLASFQKLNVIRTCAGIMLVAAPCMATLWTPHLAAATAGILLVRIVQSAALLKVVADRYGWNIQMLVRQMFSSASRGYLRQLLSFGGWLTLSSLIGPAIVYADRFVLASVVGTAAVTLYAIPFDVVARLPLVVTSICAVLLPELVRRVMAVSAGSLSADEWLTGILRATFGVGAVLMAVVPLLYAITPSLVSIWMGESFAANAAPVTQILLIAFAFNTVAQIPYTALLSLGQTRVIATIHAAEILPYLALLWWMVSLWGAGGAAYACLVRALFDFIFLTIASRRKALSLRNH